MATCEGGALSRFCDYFVICGLDHNSGLEVLSTYEIDGTSEVSTSPPLQRSYKAKILAHYPDHVHWNPFDQDAVRNLCLPDGLLFRTQKHTLEPCFHPFLITRENGSRIYGFSFIFYEQVDSLHVAQAIQTLQAMHLQELSSAKNYQQKRATQNRNIRNAQATLHHKHKGKHRAQAALQLADDDGCNTRSLPRHFKLAAHKQQAMLTQSFYDASKDTLYVTKAIALICPLPFVQAARHFLTGLYKHVKGQSGEELSAESLVYHLLYYVPLPPPSRSVQLNYWNERLTCPRPAECNELPLFDFFMSGLFRLLDLDSFLQLFTCVLLENQVLLYSKDLHRLMLVAESVTTVLFPFVWQHVYVPILPSTLHHFLDAPVPFIMGLHAVTETKDNIPCEANLCFVDIDNNQVSVPEDLPTFPQRSELIQELAQVLHKYNIPLGNLNKVSSTRGSPYRMRRSRGRKNSWSHDSDSGMSSNEECISLNGSQLNLSSSSHRHNHHMSSSYHSTQRPLELNLSVPKSESLVLEVEAVEQGPFDEVYLQNLKLNNAIREIFCNRFVHMFASYDHFLSQPNEDLGRMFVHNFDKATFLSDQPDQNLPFLSRFIETQMFASLIDRKIACLAGDTDPHQVIFEQRIKLLRDQFGESVVRSPSASYEPCSSVKESEHTLEKRFLNPDFVAPPVQEILTELTAIHSPSSPFPILNALFLNIGPSDTRNTRLLREVREPESLPANPSLRNMFQPKQTTSSPASIAQANWDFVKALLQDPHGYNYLAAQTKMRHELLKECKTKTKRMLVEKMGPEAVALGHGEVSILGVEENTLVASLCDLLERIWAHGLHVKGKGRSPLWNYLTNYQESESFKDSSKPIDPQFLTPALAFGILRKRLDIKTTKMGRHSLGIAIKDYLAKIDLSAMASELNINVSSRDAVQRSPEKRERRSRALDLPVLTPLPVSIAHDMRNVQGMTEIKTEIGYARAWIRLSLEKKVLSKHLRALLSDDQLLRGFYKRTAFLRCEEEREQFLYHLLTLNAADYFCFTNSYLNILLPYRVLIFPSKRFNLSTTSANVWISVSGTMGETNSINVPKSNLEFVFQHKNLGLLTNMHIGHDNSGLSPKWLVDLVIVRNEVTGHVVKFPCGRWLGRDVDDGSTERLLVGEHFVEGEEAESCMKTPPRARSPSVPRKSYEPTRVSVSTSEIQECLGNAVNKIVKYFFKADKERGSLTVLLCGENGLVASLEQVFMFNFKSSRLFGRNIYLWDYFVQVCEALENAQSDENWGMTKGKEERLQVCELYCELIHKINHHANSLGKNGKFQLLICLCAREHLLHRLPPLLTNLHPTRLMYEESSFLRDSELLADLVQVLLALDDYDIVLEQSLSKGIE